MLRVLVTNIKGGCGKTTLATNLAAAFAAGGFVTGLAEVDRQRSSLSWLKLRDAGLRPIQGLDWRRDIGEVPDTIRRLVIDAPANLRMRHVDDLIREADLVVVPVLASVLATRSKVVPSIVTVLPTVSAAGGAMGMARTMPSTTRRSGAASPSASRRPARRAVPLSVIDVDAVRTPTVSKRRVSTTRPTSVGSSPVV